MSILRYQKPNVKTLNKNYFDNFKTELTVFSPGRINFIGEHTDYNNGFVLPTAIDKKIFFSFKKNESKKQCNIYSKNYDAFLTIDLDNVLPSEEEWENYILGVIKELQKRNATIEGFDCIIESELPIGAGISSSAALECGIALGLNSLFDLQFPSEELIKLSRDAEHNFVGTKCGIMDQFAVVMSKEEHALLLDCESLQYELIPVDIYPYKILLLNTNISHNLATSEYNKRREECEAGIEIIKKKYPAIDSLREVTFPILEEVKSDLSATVYNRCKYVISENTRVIEAVDKLKEGDLKSLGKLMYQSHEGLRDLYNVSCTELDFLVDFTLDHEQILGSRMMGGGFGGCTINIIHKDYTKKYIEEVSSAYKKAFQIDLTAIEVNPSGGTYVERH